MKRTVLLGAAALGLVALAVIFAPVALGQKQEAQADGGRITEGNIARIMLKSGRVVFIDQPRAKLIGGQPFVGGMVANHDLQFPRPWAQWFPVSDVALVDDFENRTHMRRVLDVEERLSRAKK
jgi:hypothetical protein